MKNVNSAVYPDTYIQLLNYIRQFSKTNATNRLPSEENLATQLGVSRVKIRDVLSQLEAAGYILRRRGVGTLVNRYVLSEVARLDIDNLYVDVVEECGLTSRAQISSPVLVEHPSLEIEDKLQLQTGEGVYRLEKIVYGDEKAVIHITDYVPARYFETRPMNLELLGENFFYFVQDVCGAMLETAVVHVDAITADKKMATTMGVAEGFPLLQLNSVCFSEKLEPVLYSQEYYNTKLVPFAFQKRVLNGKFKNLG